MTDTPGLLKNKKIQKEKFQKFFFFSFLEIIFLFVFPV